MGPRLASNVGGRLQACANCLEGVRPFAILFTLFIVTDDDGGRVGHDVASVQGIKRAADHLLGTLQRVMKGGGPLGRMHRAYSQSWSIRKVDVGMKGCVMTCDAVLRSYRPGNRQIRPDEDMTGCRRS